MALIHVENMCFFVCVHCITVYVHVIVNLRLLKQGKEMNLRALFSIFIEKSCYCGT